MAAYQIIKLNIAMNKQKPIHIIVFFGAVFNSTIVSSNANLVSTPATAAVGLFQRLDHMEQQLLPT